jgi:type IV pilus assembly protein PilB
MKVEPFLTASTIILVVAQRLMRAICKFCKEPYEIDAEHIIGLGVNPEQLKGVKKVTLYRGRGCDKCAKGYKGRIGAYEVMEMTDGVRELILERAPAHLVRQAARKDGMISLRESALRKLIAGTTTVEEVLRVTIADVDELQ